MLYGGIIHGRGKIIAVCREGGTTILVGMVDGEEGELHGWGWVDVCSIKSGEAERPDKACQLLGRRLM